MDARIEVKVEDYDGTYVCLFCGESVRGQPALKCSHCSSNPFHLACVALAHSKYAEVCPTCDRKTVEAWVMRYVCRLSKTVVEVVCAGRVHLTKGEIRLAREGTHERS